MNLGLPSHVTACLFDLDGVLTDTAGVHEAAWKQMFDAFLAEDEGIPGGTPSQPFTAHDYTAYVDGKPRADGVRDFLASRRIHLPEGPAGDARHHATVEGLGQWKNDLVQQHIREHGVRVFEGSRRYVQAVRAAGLATAVVSSSANTAQVLQVTGLSALFDTRVDGVTARQLNLAGKPAPDMFLAAARALRREPSACAVFEDALAGVAAGHAGHFALVVGVDRATGDQVETAAADLRHSGASVVVRDLAELMVADPQQAGSGQG